MAITNLADQFGFFLKTSAPTDRWDDTEYTEAMYVTQIQFQHNNELLTITNLSSTGTVRKFAEFLLGTQSVQFQIQGFWDITEDAGQEIAYQAAIAHATQAATLLYWLLTTTLSGVKELAGSLYVVSMNNTLQVGQAPTFNWTVQATGQVFEQAGA